jgi:hypothetical protein
MNVKIISRLANIFYKKASDFEVPQELLNVITGWVLKAVCRQMWKRASVQLIGVKHSITELRGELSSLNNKSSEYREISTALYSAQYNYKEMLEIIDICKIYAQQADQFVIDSIKEYFPLQLLLNWKYLDKEIEQKNALGLLKYVKWPDKIPISIYFGNNDVPKYINTDALGTYATNRNEDGPAIFLVFKLGLTSSYMFEKQLNQLKGTIRHELQHLCQDAMYDIKSSLMHIPGTPSKRTLPQIPKVLISDTEKELYHYILKEQEFYPLLKDSIEDFNRLLPEESDPEKFFKFFIGDKPAGYRPNNKETTSPNYFIAGLRHIAPERWEKAVKELWKSFNN